MTVASTTNKQSYNGNGTQSVFAYTFKIFVDADIKVYVGTTLKTINTHYTLSGVGTTSGGNVTFTAGNFPVAGTGNVTLLRSLALTQGVDLINYGKFDAEVVEAQYDKIVMMVQQLQEQSDRTIKFSTTVSDAGGVEITDTVAERSNKVLAYDNAGDLSVANELGEWKGNWATSTAFAARDLVLDTATNNVYICLVGHTSGTLSTDVTASKWALVINAAAVATSAATATTKASEASTSASTAQDWAEKTDGVVTGSSYSAKHWATTGTVATVSAAIANVNLTAGSIANVNTTAGSIANVNKVAAVDSNVTTVAGIDSNVTTVAGIASNVTTVAGKSAQITLLGTSDAVADMNTLGTADVVTDMNTLGTSDVVSDMNTLAAISANITTAAGIAANITTTAGISSNVSTVAGIAANITTNANNIAAIQGASAAATLASNSAAAAAASFDSFDDRYLGAKASEVSVNNDGDALVAGNLYFLTGTGMQVYDGANWIAASSSGNVSMYVYEYIATANQTTFSGADSNSQTLSYAAGNIIVSYGGYDLPKSDYTATNGTSVVLDDGAVVGEIVRIVAFQSFVVANTYTQSQADVLLAAKAANTALATTNTAVALKAPIASPVFTGNVSHGDNVKAKFGTGNDLEIFHDGSHSRIKDVGTGHLVLSGGEVHFNNSDNSINHLVINSAGIVTKPLQPAFSAYAVAAQNNLSTAYNTITFDTERFDQNADFNTSTHTFTAPVTGKYLFAACVGLKAIPLNCQWIFTRIITSNAGYNMSEETAKWDADTSNGFHTGFALSVLADMDAGDTASVQVYQYTGTTSTDVSTGAGYTWFTGYLVA